MITATRSALGIATALAFLTVTGTTAATATEEGGGTDLNASIVWVDVTMDATVEVPWDTGETTSYSTSVGSYCTGFFVSNEGHIATAGHCVEAGPTDYTAAISNVLATLNDEGHDVSNVNPAKLEWKVAFSRPSARVGQPSGIPSGIFSGGDYYIAQVVDYQPFGTGDNALLRVADLADTPALPISDQTPQVGDKVTAIGFPGSVMSVADVQRQLPSYKSGYVSSRQYSTQGVPNTEIDAAVSGGMSGGPTINEAGEVIGINSFSITGETQQFNFVTDTETLRDFLTSNGVELATTPAPPEAGDVAVTDSGADKLAPVVDTTEGGSDADEGSPMLVWVLLAAAIVVLGAGGLALALAQQAKRRDTLAPSPTPQSAAAQMAASAPQSPVTLAQQGPVTPQAPFAMQAPVEPQAPATPQAAMVTQPWPPATPSAPVAGQDQQPSLTHRSTWLGS